MLEARTRTGNVSVTRGRAWSNYLSSLDLDGDKPTNLEAVNNIHYVMFWRDLCGKIFDGYATEADNRFLPLIPASQLNPSTDLIYLSAYWVMTDGSELEFLAYNFNMHDIPSSYWNSWTMGFSYPDQAQVDFMSAVHYINGHKVQVKINQHGIKPNEATYVYASIFASETDNRLTRFAVGAQVAATGQDVICEIYVDDVATGNVLTLPAGITEPVESTISILVE